jgi:hypothetical protein
LISIFKFERERKQEEYKVKKIDVEQGADVKHYTAFYYPEKRIEIYLRKKAGVKKIKNNPGD